MTKDPLTKAWIWLVVLSAGSAVVAILVSMGVDRRIAGAMILTLALLKSRTILSQYLGLCNAPFWRRGMNIALAVFCGLIFVLYLVGGTTA